MLAKLLSVLASALTLSILFTFVTSTNDLSDKTALYSFMHQLVAGVVLLLFAFLLVGLPLSVLADQLVFRLKTKLTSLLRLVMYGLFGAAAGAVFLFVNPASSSTNGTRLPVMFGIAGLVFALYVVVFDYIGKRSSKSSL